MRKGQGASSSSESEEDPQSKDAKDESSSSSRGCSSSDQDSSSDSDVETGSAMKRSRGFSISYSFAEEDDPPQNENRGEELSQRNSNPVPVAELVEAELAAECTRLEKGDTFCDANPPQRSCLFRPQEIWFAMTRCLSLRWPPCLSVSRQSTVRLAYQLDLDQSEEDTESTGSSESANDSSSCTSTPADRSVTLLKREEVGSRGVKKAPPPRRRWVSRSSPRVPRARQTMDSLLASVLLEKEMFLRIELVDSGDEREDLRYRAEWKLSEKTQELAEGVWLSSSQKN